ncbi:hypothetical protein [Galbibacter sp.]|uniref:hypothetical protein n=1 Tax=Galbibacter sp. TaxID=2918471 RepID=UPI003A8D5B14
MMKHLKALVISDKKVSAKILNWKLDVIHNVEDALVIIQQQDYRIIAIDNSIAEAEKQKLEAIAKLFNNAVSIVRYNTEEELSDNIMTAFRIQKMASLKHNYMDNAFELELASKLKMN